MLKLNLQVLAIIFVFLGTIYFALTDTIYSIPIAAPPLSWLPVGYWVLIAITFALAATIIVKETPSTTDYLIVFLLLFVLYFGPELMENSVRVRDSYSFLYLTNYVTSPAIYNQTSYSQYNYLPNWPGFFYIVSILYQILGIGYYIGAKVVFIVGQAIILLLSFSLGRVLFQSRRGSVLFGLFTVVLGWDVWTNPSPLLFGEVFLLSILLVIMLNGRMEKKMTMFVLMYSAVTMIHGLTPLLFLPILALVAILPLIQGLIRNSPTLVPLRMYFANRVFSFPLRASVGYLVFAVSVFLFWFTIAPTAFNRGNLTAALNFIFHSNLTPLVSQITSVTPFRYPSVLSAAVFLSLLLVSFGVILFGSIKGAGVVSVQALLLLIVATGVVYFFLPTSQDFYDRMFEDGFPFLAWFLVTGTMRFRWKPIYVTMVLLMLASGFVAAYSHESVNVYPLTENAGDSYLLNYSTSSTVIAYLTNGPTAQGISDAPRAPTMLELTANQTTDIQYLMTADTIVNSSVVKNGLLYYYGYSLVDVYLVSHQMTKVYDSGSYALYQNLR